MLVLVALVDSVVVVGCWMLKIGVVCSVNGRSGVGGIIVTFGTSTVSSLRVNAASSLEGEGEGEVVGPIDLSKGPIDAPPNRRSS